MRILIVKLSSIGDVIHTLPAAALLKRALPDARISWAVEPRGAAILKDSPAIDELIELQARPAATGLRKRLNGSGLVDIAIDFQGLIKSGLVMFASRATRRVGFGTDDLREKASKLFLTEQVDASKFKHVIEKNLALARAAVSDSLDGTAAALAEIGPTPALPGSNNGYEFPIALSADDEQFAERVVENQRGPFAIINPGGGWATKLWAPERYAELADWLWNDCGMVSLVTYGPGEEELAGRVVASSRSSAVRALASTLKQFVALARRAVLFVGGDTGPLHLAAASGTPIVGLYGPTSAERNGPFDPRDITIARDLWCRADCYRRSCWHWECMEIPVSDVKRAVLTRLERAQEVAV
jgi:heptosyltransferase I